VPSASAEASWWLAGGVNPANVVAAYQAKGAASYAASKVNLANPGTYDATEGVAPSWDAATGWTGNGTTMYLDTGVALLGTYTALIRLTNVKSGAMHGVAKWPRQTFFRPNNFVAQSFGWGNTSFNRGAAATAGVFGLAGNQPYTDGAAAGDAGDGYFTPGAETFFILAANSIEGTPFLFDSGDVAASVIYDNVLTADQMAAISAAMAAL